MAEETLPLPWNPVDVTSRTGRWRNELRTLVLLIALFLLLADGRMDSADANAELQGTLNLVRTGSVGSDHTHADSAIQALFVASPHGRFYEAHDIGNSLFMLPAAWIGDTVPRIFPRLGPQGSVGTYSDSSLILTKTLCSLTETLFSAIACYFLFLVFHLFLGRQASMVLALLFPFGTYFAGYFRSSWDVVPACNSFCILLYHLTSMFSAKTPRASTPVWAAFWCGITCMFRYSLLPFLGLSMIFVFWQNRFRFHMSSYLFGAILFSATLLPTLLFNLVRMGMLLEPATMAPQFADQNGLTWNIIPAATGLLFSPNRGLFVFSPILLLVFALPRYWGELPAAVRATLTCLAPGIFLYFLLISRLRNWGAAGWGPRYLLPVLPVFFLAAGLVLTILWNRSRAWRVTTAMLILISCSVAIPSILVNYTAATGWDPTAINTGAREPRQITYTVKALTRGLQERFTTPVDARGGEAVVVFPDLIATRIFSSISRKSGTAAIAFVVLYLIAMASVVSSLTRKPMPA